MSFASAVDKNKLETMTGMRFPDDATGSFTIERKPIPEISVRSEDRLYVAEVKTSREMIVATANVNGLPPLEPVDEYRMVCEDEERSIGEWWFPPDAFDLKDKEYTSRYESGYYTLIVCGLDKNEEYVTYIVRTNKSLRFH